jgi:hypothetical protein
MRARRKQLSGPVAAAQELALCQDAAAAGPARARCRMAAAQFRQQAAASLPMEVDSVEQTDAAEYFRQHPAEAAPSPNLCRG